MPDNTSENKTKQTTPRWKRWLKNASLSALRLSLFAVMLLMLLCSVFWLLLLHDFNAQHLSELITTTLQKKLDRPVAISSLELKTLNSVEIKGFYVLDTKGSASEALLAADRVILRFGLWPLIAQQQLHIDEVSLYSPRFSVVRQEDGTYNIPKIKTGKALPVPGPKEGKQMVVQVDDWTINEGVLRYKDMASGVSHALYGLNLHFEQLRFDRLSHFTADMVLRNTWSDGISDMEIKGAGQVNFADFDWSKFALRSFKAKVYAFQKPIEVVADVDNLRTPFFNIRAEVPAFESKNLSVFHLEKTPFSVPKSTVTAKGGLSKNYHLLKISQATVNAADVKATGKGQFNFAEEPYSADLSFSTNFFKLEDKHKYYPKLTAYKLQGKGSLEGRLVHEKEAYKLPVLLVKAQEAGGDFYGFKAENVTGEWQMKENLDDLYAATTEGKVTVKNTVFDHFNFSGTWRKGNLYAYIASTEVNGVPLKMSLSVNNLKKNNRRIRTAMYWKKLDPMAFIDTVQDFVDVIVPLVPGPHTQIKKDEGKLSWLRNFRSHLPNFMPNFSGVVVADSVESKVLSGEKFNAEFELTGLKYQMPKLSGNIQARLENGVVHQMEKWAEEQEALNITFQPFIIMHRMERAGSFKMGKVLKDVPFKEMAASTTFENGNMQINNSYMVGASISAAVSGWTDWVKEKFDMMIWTMFSNTSRSGALAENLTDESGDPALAFSVEGSMLKPKVEMKRAKKTGVTIREAQAKGLGTDFKTGQDFVKGDFHAKK